MAECSEDASEHVHCSKCFSRHCNESAECPTERCPHGCGAFMHRCKQTDHLSVICPNVKVPCYNMGCPAQILRGRLAEHIRHCPGSVVYCTMEWNRWPIHSPEREERVPFKLPNTHAKEDQLDVALALRDQRVLNSSLSAPRHVRASLRNPLTRRFPAVPIEHSSNRMIADDEEQNVDRSRSNTSEDPQAPWVAKRDPPGLASSIKKQLLEETVKRTDHITEDANPAAISSEIAGVSDTTKDIDIFSNIGDCEAATTAAKTPETVPSPPPLGSLHLSQLLSLDLNLELITRYQAKPKSMYTFLCAQNLRRDEFQVHYEVIHGDIHSGLSGWIEQRCPLANQGCSYHRRRMDPVGGTILYSDIVESFGIKPTDNSVVDDDKKVVGLSCLPVELLRHILTYLDGFSLNNIAMVSHHLRQVVSTLLPTHGLVIPAWMRTNGSWQILHYRWMFSKNCHRIKSWKFLDYAKSKQPVETDQKREEPHMSVHLAECYHNKWSELPNRPVALLSAHIANCSMCNVDAKPVETWEVLKRMYPDWDPHQANN